MDGAFIIAGGITYRDRVAKEGEAYQRAMLNEINRVFAVYGIDVIIPEVSEEKLTEFSSQVASFSPLNPVYIAYYKAAVPIQTNRWASRAKIALGLVILCWFAYANSKENPDVEGE